ncbi:MAG TPA: hypothetical protein VJ742_11990 [Nitrososphaera sp.]|nr:hypothetical protein [Nitrososphaera sp.]
MVIKKFLSDPFAGKVHTDAESQDERDWNSFINEKREQLDDPDWDPIKFTDGTASSTWLDSWRRGRNGS